MDGLELMALQADVLFTRDARGRLVAKNAPGGRPAPDLYIAAGAGGNRCWFGRGVSDQAAAAVEALMAPLRDLEDVRELSLAAFARALDGGAGAPRPLGVHLTFALERQEAPEGAAELVLSGTGAATELAARVRRDGMPADVVEAGFPVMEEFWEPWCIALVGGEMAATAFGARLGSDGAEVGVYTFPRFRGRRLAGAVTAAWSVHPALGMRTIFYSTALTNLASRAVARKLGLPLVGTSVAITRG